MTDSISVRGRIYDVVRFAYLGSILTYDDDVEAEVSCRVGKSVFQHNGTIMDIVCDQRY